MTTISTAPIWPYDHHHHYDHMTFWSPYPLHPYDHMTTITTTPMICYPSPASASLSERRKTANLFFPCTTKLFETQSETGYISYYIPIHEVLWDHIKLFNWFKWERAGYDSFDPVVEAVLWLWKGAKTALTLLTPRFIANINFQTAEVEALPLLLQYIHGHPPRVNPRI